jgi:hypothetical protein
MSVYAMLDQFRQGYPWLGLVRSGYERFCQAMKVRPIYATLGQVITG